MLSADFWQDKNNSQRVIKEKKFYEDLTNSLNNNVEKLKDLDDLYQLAIEEKNLSIQNEVFDNINLILKDDGFILFEVSYLLDVLNKNLFDTIYHEHLSYHSVMPIIKFLELKKDHYEVESITQVD